MSNGNNSFENPARLGVVDYSKGFEKAMDGIKDAGASMANLAEQRKKAYDDLVADFEEYNDLTKIDAAKSLDAQQQKAIRDSVSMNLVDFSNLSPEEKQANLRYVEDVKLAQESLDYIIETVRDPNVVLDKRADAPYYAFWSDLKRMKNIEIIPREDGIGFKVKHYMTDDEGNQTGESIEYDQNQLMGMTTMVEDTGDVLDGIDKKIQDAADMLYKDQVNAKNANKPWDRKSAVARARELFNRMPKNEREIYYSEHVAPFEDLSPSELFNPETGESRQLTKQERVNLKNVNEEKLFNYMMQRVDERIPEYHKPIPTWKPDSGDNDGKGKATQVELDEVSNFKEAHARAKISKDPSKLNLYTRPMGLQVRRSKDGQNFIIESNSAESKEILEQIMDASGKKYQDVSKSKTVAEVPLTDDELFYRIYQSSVLSQKGAISKQYNWVRFMDEQEIRPSFWKEVEGLKQEELDRVGLGNIVINPSGGVIDSSEKEEISW